MKHMHSFRIGEARLSRFKLGHHGDIPDPKLSDEPVAPETNDAKSMEKDAESAKLPESIRSFEDVMRYFQEIIKSIAGAFSSLRIKNGEVMLNNLDNIPGSENPANNIMLQQRLGKYKQPGYYRELPKKYLPADLMPIESGKIQSRLPISNHYRHGNWAWRILDRAHGGYIPGPVIQSRAQIEERKMSLRAMRAAEAARAARIHHAHGRILADFNSNRGDWIDHDERMAGRALAGLDPLKGARSSIRALHDAHSAPVEIDVPSPQPGLTRRVSPVPTLEPAQSKTFKELMLTDGFVPHNAAENFQWRWEGNNLVIKRRGNEKEGWEVRTIYPGGAMSAPMILPELPPDTTVVSETVSTQSASSPQAPTEEKETQNIRLLTNEQREQYRTMLKEGFSGMDLDGDPQVNPDGSTVILKFKDAPTEKLKNAIGQLAGVEKIAKKDSMYTIKVTPEFWEKNKASDLVEMVLDVTNP